MKLKTILFFISTCFVVLVSLDAIADDASRSERPGFSLLEAGQKESVLSPETTEDAIQQCEEETKAAGQPKLPSETKTVAKKSLSTNSNLSFNFMYYILYKFKYIDSFGLSTPDQSRSSKDQENLIWH